MPANPEQTSSPLSVGDLWKGCELLARSPQMFTSAISSCTIESDAGGRMIRSITFQQGQAEEMKQEIILTDMHKFDCITLETGNRVTTIIFRGVTDSPQDLYLSLEYSIPYGQNSTEGLDGEKFRAMYTERAKRNLVDGLKTIRQLKLDGKLH
ncbi:hypothetical protein AJ80_05553 [Polytolypa hystricis UAMH7299]|uniref:Uncharacterized protein n=1 Tax=Polytolypa hystricis (strain UAMH7299) TaxID=1447883 RepID=A0A2B7Y2L7_POLH7|nr:hypothetical protein AJ80_05553 [Polytolypa hystricis UAMH7299]